MLPEEIGLNFKMINFLADIPILFYGGESGERDIFKLRSYVVFQGRGRLGELVTPLVGYWVTDPLCQVWKVDTMNPNPLFPGVQGKGNE